MEPSAEHPDAPTLQLEVARFGEVGAEVLPGTSYSYSNPGYNTLGALVEIASGQSLESFLKERIYRPLGMADSYNHEIAEKLDGKLDRMGAVYYESENGAVGAGWEPGDPPQMPFVRASGGMISTAWDYAIFCQMFLNGGVYGGKRILQAGDGGADDEPHLPDLGRRHGVLRVRLDGLRRRQLLPQRIRRDVRLDGPGAGDHRARVHADAARGEPA